MSKICIFDIDGTLADIEHRLHHIKPTDGSKKKWGTFFYEAKNDKVYQHTKLINFLMHTSEVEIYLVTGRPDNLREDTQVWLMRNDIRYDHLLMRPAAERKPDYEVKKDLFNLHLADRKDDVICVFEDRLPVAKMWTELGLRVCVCGTEWLDKDWSN